MMLIGQGTLTIQDQHLALYIFIFSRGAISWSSKKQKIMTLKHESKIYGFWECHLRDFMAKTTLGGRELEDEYFNRNIQTIKVILHLPLYPNSTIDVNTSQSHITSLKILFQIKWWWSSAVQCNIWLLTCSQKVLPQLD